MRNSLRGKQGVAHDIFVRAATAKVRNETLPPEQQQALPAPMNNGNALMLLLGFGGSGKSWTIDAIVHTLTSAFPNKRVMVVATTGKAASQIQGSTVHSWKHGLCLPVSFHTKRALSARSKQAFQHRMQNVIAIILDEYSMLSQEDMYWLDFRLKEAFPDRSNQPFGGVPILLAGE
jgi:signal recognition particle GTPase